MTAPVAYWLLAIAVAVAAFPVGLRFFWRLPDGGAGLSFVLGVTLAGYAWFILRTAGVVEAGAGGALLVIAMLGLAGAWALGEGGRHRSHLRRCVPGAIVAAGLFTFLFFAFVSFRSYLPDIEGTEQPMDLMYLATAMESKSYPPEDAWLSGNRASYYYFGYVQGGMLSSAAGVPASTGYNLHLGFVFAAAGTAMASVAAGGARWLAGSRGRRAPAIGATAGVILLLFAGSLSTWFEWGASQGASNNAVYRAFGMDTLLPCDDGATTDCYNPAAESATWYPTEFFWWFDTSRVIPDTITEFPAFSFVLGDLHPHVMSLPLVLLVAALALTTMRGRGLLELDSHRRAPVATVVIALLVGALAFQNAWDLITFTALFSLAVAVRNLRSAAMAGAARATFGYLGPIFGAAAIAYFPWYVDFSSQAGGIYPYAGPGTRPAHALLQYGPVLLPALVAGLAALRGLRRAQIAKTAVPGSVVALLPVLAWVAFAGVRGELGDAVQARGTGGWVTGAALTTVSGAFVALALAAAERRRTTALLLAVGAFGSLLLLGAELFVIRDVFFGSVPRLNTVFKLSYQAWVLFALAGGAGLGAVLAGRWQVPGVRVAAGAGVAWLVAVSLFSILAVAARTEGFSKETEIDGLASLARNDPDTYALSRWITENTERGSVIIEGSGRTWGVDASGGTVITNPNVDYGGGS
ncbi:MAG TPA: DUF2298 domain-containing protein, partial [Tepidiformaceae bacterium]|nr:DUF2298 domain-containing protein [Tepidiformaceae bacterium]